MRAVAPTAKSLILDLLSTLRRGAMPVAALVAAGELFGIGQNRLRVALARLLAAGQVERDARGRYRLASGAGPVQRQVVAWRHPERRTRPWSGAFIGVQGRPPGERRARRAHDRSLAFLGFRPLDARLEIRPDNLTGGVRALREALQALGLDAGSIVFTLRDLDPATETRARGLWDAETLHQAYAASLREIEESARRLPQLSTQAAMVESFSLGGRMIRQLVLDPLLPEPIASTEGRDALVEAMRRYDRLGRACWGAFLARFDVPHLSTPADTRIEEGRLASVSALKGMPRSSASLSGDMA